MVRACRIRTTCCAVLAGQSVVDDRGVRTPVFAANTVDLGPVLTKDVEARVDGTDLVTLASGMSSVANPYPHEVGVTSSTATTSSTRTWG